MSDTIPSHVKPFALTHVSTAVAYHFKTGIHCEWAICTVNDATCELTIQSDWGNWAYRWSGSGFPKRGNTDERITLTEFIADRQAANYLADKLWGGGYGGRVFDAEETVNAWRKALCEHRLEQGRAHARSSEYMWKKERYYAELDGEPLTAGIAREIWDALDDLRDCRNGDHFIEKAFQVKGIDWIHEEPWNHLEEVQDGKYAVLLYGILPALIAECGKRDAPPADLPAACGAV